MVALEGLFKNIERNCFGCDLAVVMHEHGLLHGTSQT